MGFDETNRVALVLIAIGAGVAALLVGLVCRQCVVGRLEEDERRRGKAPAKMVVGNPAVAYLDPAPQPIGHYYPPSYGSPASNGGYAKPTEFDMSMSDSPVHGERSRQEDEVVSRIIEEDPYLRRDSRKSRRVTIAALDNAPAEVSQMLAELDMKTAILKDGGNAEIASDALLSMRSSDERVTAESAMTELAAAREQEQQQLAKREAERRQQEELAKQQREAEEMERMKAQEKKANEDAAAKAVAAEEAAQAEKAARDAAEERKRKEQEEQSKRAQSVWERASPTLDASSASPPASPASPSNPSSATSDSKALSPRLAKLHAEAAPPPPFQIVRFKKPAT